MGTGNPLTTLSQQLEAVVSGADGRTVQVRAGHARPATGTVISGDRVIVAAHTVDADALTVVRADGTSHAAELVGADPATDLAILRAAGLSTGPFEPGPPARVGELAIGLGRTWSGSLVASAGIVSAIGGPLRTGRNTSIEQVLRADVRVHPLGAGGPLVDVDGGVIGIASGGAIRGAPVFVPAAIAWRVAESISVHGRIRRGYLGISAQPVRIPPAQRAGGGREAGLLVVAIAAGSPVEQAGLMVGDIVLAFGGRPVEDHDELLALLGAEPIGASVAIDVIRGAEARSFGVTIGEV